ncbi:hypothetical protein M569_10552, partial [Genlisea aurea]
MSGTGAGVLETLSAVCDAFLPSIDDGGGIDIDPSAADFYRTSASMSETPRGVMEMLAKARHPKISLAVPALWFLSTRIGSVVLCGRRCVGGGKLVKRFSELPVEEREEILAYWSRHFLPHLRIFYHSLKFFTLLRFFTHVDENGENVSWKAIGYCGPDPTRNGGPFEVGPLHRGIINLDREREPPPSRALSLYGFPVSKGGEGGVSFTIECDAVVVGSGSGGGVVAGVLAKSGHKVLVIEKGSYSARSDLTLLEGQSMERMYLEKGLLASDDMSVLFVAGSTVGGGSTINWSASIRTPPHVRREWSDECGLRLFQSEDYDDALDVVSERMSVQKEVEDEGLANMVLRRGCETLGYAVENIPRNAPSDHYCGWCSFGCRDGRKHGTSETWLVDLVESGNGAILPNCEAIKVITQMKKTTTINDGRSKKAVGITFRFRNPNGDEEIAAVRARAVVSSCGAICTPPLLKRSGLKNPNIGRNLHIHPVVMAWGYFPATNPWPEADKRSYEGGIMTAMAKSRTGDTIIQTPSLHPGMFSALTPWISGRDIKNRMLKFSRTAHIFSLARDAGSGTVTSESNISYRLDDADRENLGSGLEEVLRVLAAAGAEEIGTHHRDGRSLKVKKKDRDDQAALLERFIKEESRKPLEKESLSSPICSAHQMGSCRMGTDPLRSAVDPNGETWEVGGLFVADTSVFPTALGVNPMLTVQAISYCISKSVLNHLKCNKYT